MDSRKIGMKQILEQYPAFKTWSQAEKDYAVNFIILELTASGPLANKLSHQQTLDIYKENNKRRVNQKRIEYSNIQTEVVQANNQEDTMIEMLDRMKVVKQIRASSCNKS